MTRGFATIATGQMRYYAIAANLLASYRHFSAEPMPFAVICDRENEYTRLFDEVVLLDAPACSYLDKLALPTCAPYDETIFIDADCLAYRDLNDFWGLFENASDFSVFGSCYPTDYPYAWFTLDGTGEYADRIEFIPDFIGGVYFIRKTPQIEAFADTCAHILNNYRNYTFRQFEEPADEPVYALAMAAHGFKPIDGDLAPICFYPHAIGFESDISNGRIVYKSRYEHDERQWAYMVHWGSGNTSSPPYATEANRLECAAGRQGAVATACGNARAVVAYRAKALVVAVLSKLHARDLVRKLRNALRKRPSNR